MRIAHYSPFHDLSGAQRSMLTLAAEQIRGGGACLVFCPINNAVANAARRIGAVVEVAFPGKVPSNEVRRASALAWRFRRAARAFGAEVLHCHSAAGNGEAWLMSRLAWIPLVTHQRDRYVRDRFHRWLWLGDRVIAISQFVLGTLPPRIRAKATMIYNAANLPADPPPPRRGGRLRIGMAGRCVPEKGFDLLVEAALERLRRGDDFEVHLWGLNPGRYSQEFRAKVEGIEPIWRDRFHLAPFRDDIDEFYRTVDVVVVPSRYAEPFGRTAIEAMAWRRPVLVAGHGGLAEIVEPGQTGLTFKPNDAADLAAQLGSLLGQPEMRDALSRQGYDAVTRRFSPEVHARAVEGVYRQALGRRAPATGSGR